MHTFTFASLCIALSSAATLKTLTDTSPDRRATASDSCTDQIPNCADYGPEICSNKEYAVWVSAKCCAFCKDKEPSGGTFNSTGSCTDRITNCAAYGKSVCTDSYYTQWVMDNCCAFCGGSGPVRADNGCIHKGKFYQRGMSWHDNGCEYNCFCDDGATGHYNCADSCVSCSDLRCICSTSKPHCAPQSTDFATGMCRDAISNCNDYTQSICSDATYDGWVSENCPAFCNKCSNSCVDSISNCAAYGHSVCTNTDYTQWVLENCPKYCNMCGTRTGDIDETMKGCIYKGQVYRQDESWEDGCDFKCSCTDAATGKYTCNQLCVQWQIPQQCSLKPPAPGKCCFTPSCPAGYTINYPPGHMAE